MNYRPKKRKTTAIERQEERRQHIARTLEGKGLYIFENITKGDLWLPKKSADGSKGPIPPGGQWKGDDYFVGLVKNRDAKMVKVLVSPQEQIMPQKLLVDQPDRVTVEGVVEQIVAGDMQPLNEGEPVIDSPKSTVLITEDPLQGVEILMD